MMTGNEPLDEAKDTPTHISVFKENNRWRLLLDHILQPMSYPDEQAALLDAKAIIEIEALHQGKRRQQLALAKQFLKREIDLPLDQVPRLKRKYGHR